MPSVLDLDLLGKIIGEKIKEKLRSEVTSGDVNVQELTNTILKAVRDRLPTTLTASGNLKVAEVETTIQKPVDIQNHWQENVAIAPSAARTASGNTNDIDVARFLKAEICIDVTAVSGTTPTLDVYVEGKDQLSGKYKTLFSQTGINAVGTFWTPNPIDIAFKYIRARWVIGGTSPSFTFSIGLEGKS
jgi:cell wall-associated NlpC family hydrolase